MGWWIDTNQMPTFLTSWHVTKMMFAQHSGVKWGYSQAEVLARGWSHVAARTSLHQLPIPAHQIRRSA